MSQARCRGSALLAVLWLSAVLALIAFALASTVRGEAERASTGLDSARTYYLASGAVQRAILYMLWGPQYRNPDGSQRFYAYGSPVLTLAFPSGEATVEVIPEASKFNINTASPEDLFRLLVNLGATPDRARTISLAIVDWRSPTAGATAFDQYYLSLAPSFRARHASFEEIEELLLVQGMTPEIYYGSYQAVPQGEGPARLIPRSGLSDCVSVYGTNDQFDVGAAAPAVLAAIGLPPGLVEQIAERRRMGPIQQPELQALMRAAGPAAGRLRLGGNSMYTLRATARLRLADGKFSDLRRTAAALVKFMPAGYDSRYHILRWYDNAWAH